MSLEGWYYLHTNGDLIYKRELGGFFLILAVHANPAIAHLVLLP